MRSLAGRSIIASSITTLITADATTVSTPSIGPHELVRLPANSRMAAPAAGRAMITHSSAKIPSAGTISVTYPSYSLFVSTSEDWVRRSMRNVWYGRWSR